MTATGASQALFVSTVQCNKSTAVDSKHRIPELDGLRAIAILLVIGCHYEAFAASLFGLPQFGWVGVDIFFVLSGFLITSILLRLKGRPDPYIPFLGRRAARIMPPYFLVLLLVAVVAGAASPAQISRSVPLLWKHAFFALSMAQNMDYLSRIWSVVSGSASLQPLFTHSPLPVGLPGLTAFNVSSAVSHLWSVSVEEWYYVLWAPVVLLFRRTAITATACLLILLALCCRSFGFGGPEWHFNFLCRFDALAVGGLLALWIEQRHSLAEKAQLFGDRVLQCVSTVMAGCLALLLFQIRPFLGHEIRDSVAFAAFGPLLIAVTVAGIMATLLNGSSGASLPCKTLRLKPLVYIGRRSYMLYLTHVPVYVAVSLLFPLSYGILGARLWLIAVLSAALSFGIAVASWRFFESPILALGEKHRDRIIAS
jgi:peptidoglycan/LPS O-acetylase OafA/YrhL